MSDIELNLCPFCDAETMVCTTMEKAIKKWNTRALGWIPVEERLPDNNEDVLVTTDVGLITFGYFSHGKWITDQEPDYPIAWRPLPGPYRPERSDDHEGK